MDAKALAEYTSAYDQVSEKWVSGAMRVVRERNPEMYTRMIRLQDEIDRMILKDDMGKADRKRFGELVAAWKRIHELGIHFALRHLN